MELDKEEVLNELMNFEKNYGRDCESGLPDCLERFLVNIAKSGDTIYPWNKIKPVILKKIELVVNEFNTKYPYENNPVLPNVKPFNFQEMKDEIIEKFDYFYGAPFTIQRICELLTDPSKYYKRSDKFMRGLEKNVRVISTIEARRADIENEPNSFQREFTRSPKNNSSPFSPASSSNILLSSSLPSSSTSSSSSTSASSSSAFMNGLNDKEESTSLSISSRISQSCSPIQDQGPMPNSPAPLQQLDSFTTVFASPPSTPLAVVSDIHPYDAGSPSSSSSSSSESSPQPSSSSSPPPSLAHDGNELNQSIDTDFDDNKQKDDDSVDSNKSEDSNEPTKLTDEPMDQTEQDKFDEAQEKLEVEQDLIKLNNSESEPGSIKDEDAILQDAAIRDEERREAVEQCYMKESSISKETISEAKESEVIQPIPSPSESAPEKKQESTAITERTINKLIEPKDSQQTIKVESVEVSQSSVLASTTILTQSSGQSEKSDANEDDDIKCGGDALNESNDSIKTESTESANTSVEDNLTPEKDQDQEIDADQGQEPTSSGSSTVSEEETIDNSVTTSNQQPDIDEKPESH